MAKIVATFDTKDKTLIVDMDGKKFKNVSEVSFFKSFSDEGKFYADVSTVEHSEDNETVVMTRTMAEDGTIETKSDLHGKPVTDDKKKKEKKKDKTKAIAKLLFPKREF